MIKLTPGVNFINILRAAFAPIFFVPKNCACKMLMKLTPARVKAAHKMLMKLTPGGNPTKNYFVLRRIKSKLILYSLQCIDSILIIVNG